MTHTDDDDSDPTPRTPPRVPPEHDPTEPLYIREATEPPVMREAPYQAVDPTARIANRPPEYAPPGYAPQGRVAVPLGTADPVHEHYVDDRRGGWAVAAAVVALLLGGLIGFIIGRALDDDEAVTTAEAPASTVTAAATDVGATLDGLLERARADGRYRTPSEFPQLDEIVAIDRAAATADLQNQVALLTEAQEQGADLAARVTELEQQLATVTAERDQFAARIDEAGASDVDAQAELEAANQRIATLEADLSTARAQLDTANADLQRAQADRDAAVAQLDQLDPIPAPAYVDGDIGRARSDATANGWQLIEQTVESERAPGTVLDQAPAPDTNMVAGSVLVVSVAGTAP